MSTRSALLLASVVLLGAATPALAQDGRYDVSAAEAADAAADAANAAADEAQGWRVGEAVRRSDDHYGDRDGAFRDQGMRYSQTPRLAYSPEDRAAWLDDCQIVMRGEDYYYGDDQYENEDDRENGGLLGGLLGAVVGGVAGNRIGGAGDRLAGTLLGAGVGGIAGAVLGSVIAGDGRGDDHEYNGGDRQSAYAANAYAADYCAAYLRRYEASGQTGQYTAQPVIMVQAVSQHDHGHQQHALREVVREEWVEVPEERVVRSRSTQHRRAAPAQQGKLTSVD